MAEIRLRVRIAPSAARWGLAAAILGAFAGELSTENAGLSTYYPAPSGVYSQIIAAQAAYLGRDPGKNVGIGTTSPQAALDVRGVFLAGGNPVAAGLAQPCPTGYDCKQTGNLLIIAKICGAPGQPCCPGSSCNNGLTCWSGTCEGPCGGVTWSNQGCGAGNCPATSMYQVPSCSAQSCTGCPAARCAAGDPACGPTCNPPCQNGGTCTAPNTCACTGGYTGQTCAIPPPSLLPNGSACSTGADCSSGYCCWSCAGMGPCAGKFCHAGPCSSFFVP